MSPSPITSNLLMVEAGRQLMANELATVQAHWPALRLAAETTAVHETRKAIRRTFTLFKLFAPYFAEGALEPHRRGLRKMMRRLAPCRDVAVFRLNLAAYNESAQYPLVDLARYWDAQQDRFDAVLREFLEHKKARATLDRYAYLTATEGSGLREPNGNCATLLVRHALPAVILQRMGTVLACGEQLPTATTAQFHQLRIQFKELRYTLSFFEDILAGRANALIDLSRRMQEHLGNLNDASVAIDLLGRMKAYSREAAVYSDYQEEELARLMDDFMPLYAEFEQPELRQNLAAAVAIL